MSYEEFAATVAGEFDLEGVPPATARLVEDVGLDSLDCFNLVLLVDELSGAGAAGVAAAAADAAYPLITTMGDAHRYYQEALERAGG
jgi:hypothetical protein